MPLVVDAQYRNPVHREPEASEGRFCSFLQGLFRVFSEPAYANSLSELGPTYVHYGLSNWQWQPRERDEAISSTARMIRSPNPERAPVVDTKNFERKFRAMLNIGEGRFVHQKLEPFQTLDHSRFAAQALDRAKAVLSPHDIEQINNCEVPDLIALSIIRALVFQTKLSFNKVVAGTYCAPACFNAAANRIETVRNAFWDLSNDMKNILIDHFDSEIKEDSLIPKFEDGEQFLRKIQLAPAAITPSAKKVYRELRALASEMQTNQKFLELIAPALQ